MINWFKKHFIPHEGNSYRPQILHKKNIRNVVLLIIFLEIFAFLLPTLTHINKTGGMAAVLPAILGNLTNEERQTQHLNTLTDNPTLDKAALMKAEDMAKKGYFAHTSPEGLTPWYWLGKVDYTYQYAGENLAINFTDSKDVTNAWMRSPTHKANIIKGNYTEMGTGVATGMYEGRKTVFVAQVYASPLVKSSTEPKAVTVKKDDTIKEEVESSIQVQDSTVLGAETAVNNEKEEVVNPNKEKVEATNPTFWQKALASPRNTTKTILYIISGVILLSLILNVFIKVKRHHVDLVTNGLITIVIIVAILIANFYMTNQKLTVLETEDYSQTNQ